MLPACPAAFIARIPSSRLDGARQPGSATAASLCGVWPPRQAPQHCRRLLLRASQGAPARPHRHRRRCRLSSLPFFFFLSFFTYFPPCAGSFPRQGHPCRERRRRRPLASTLLPQEPQCQQLPPRSFVAGGPLLPRRGPAPAKQQLASATHLSQARRQPHTARFPQCGPASGTLPRLPSQSQRPIIRAWLAD